MTLEIENLEDLKELLNKADTLIEQLGETLILINSFEIKTQVV
ncbi:hypothetical protein [Listeria booriae]|nr:hypothetical protein [Listeria booriae]